MSNSSIASGTSIYTASSEQFPTDDLIRQPISSEKMLRFHNERERIAAGNVHELGRTAKPDLELTMAERMSVLAGLRSGFDKKEICAIFIRQRDLRPTMPSALLRHFMAYVDDVYRELYRQISISKLRNLDRSGASFKAETLSLLSAILSIEIVRINCYKSEHPVYEIETNKGKTSTFGTKFLFSFGKFEQIVADTTQRHLPPLDKSAYRDVAQAFMDASEIVDLGAEVTRDGKVDQWLASYLIEFPPQELGKDGSMLARVEDRRPYLQDGATYFFLQELHRWLLQSQRAKLSLSALAGELTSRGCIRDAARYYQADGSRSSVSVWRIVDSLDSDDFAPTDDSESSAIQYPDSGQTDSQDEPFQSEGSSGA